MDPNLVAFVIYIISLLSITVYHLPAPWWPGLSEKKEEPQSITKLLQESPCQLVTFERLIIPGKSVCEVSLKKQPGQKGSTKSLDKTRTEDTEELVCVVEQELYETRSNALALVSQKEQNQQEGLVDIWDSTKDNPLTSLVFWLVLLLLVGFLVLLCLKPQHPSSCPGCIKKTPVERNVIYLLSVQTQTPRLKKKSTVTQTETAPEKINRSSQTEGPLTNPVRESLQLLEI